MRTIRRTTGVAAFVVTLMLMPIRPGTAVDGGLTVRLEIAEACAQGTGFGCVKSNYGIPCPDEELAKKGHMCNFGCDDADDLGG